MIVVTSECIANKRIVKTLGLVRGNTVRARHVGKDIMVYDECIDGWSRRTACHRYCGHR